MTVDKQSLKPDDPKDLRVIFEEIWALNPINIKGGTKDGCFIEMKMTLSEFPELTPEILLERYGLYCSNINNINFGREPKYRTTKMSFAEWMDNKGWENTKKHIHPRDAWYIRKKDKKL